jgi:hypothetical protein
MLQGLSQLFSIGLREKEMRQYGITHYVSMVQRQRAFVFPKKSVMHELHLPQMRWCER